MFQDAFDIIKEKFGSWGNDLVNILPYFFVSLLVFFIFALIAKISKKITQKALGRLTFSKSVNKLISNLIFLTILIIGAVVALGALKLEKTVTSVLAGAGIVGLALGFAFQDLASNIISGVILSIRKPINIGDYIEAKGYFGRVMDIRLRSLEMHNLDGQIVYIPSKEVLQNPITNYTQMGKRRVVLDVGISYGDNLEKVRKVTLEAIDEVEGILKDEPVEFYYKEFGDSSINFIVRYWVNFERQPDYLQSVSDSIMNIKAKYDENDITIPFPISTLDFGIKGGEKLHESLNELSEFNFKDSNGS